MPLKDKEKEKEYQAEYYLAHKEERHAKKIAYQREYNRINASRKSDYTKKTYTQLIIRLKKDEVEQYKAKCTEKGISFSEIPKAAIKKFLNDEWPDE